MLLLFFTKPSFKENSFTRQTFTNLTDTYHIGQKMKVEKIDVGRSSLASLMHDMKKGRIRIPRFQRIFVWERKRIQELLDSMLKEYPIGTIFLWKAPSEYNHLLRTVSYLNQPPLERYQNYSLLLDGQQRLTSLYSVVNGLTVEDEDYRKIVVDLNPRDPERTFQYREPNNRRWVSVQDLLNDNFAIYNNLPSDEHRERFARTKELLINYPFSVVTVEDMNLDEAIEIFERINRLGKPLSRYDLITASVLQEDFDLREKTKNDIIIPFQKNGFGDIAETSIPQALALNIKNSTESSTQMDLKKDEVKSAWNHTVESFRFAIEYVQLNLGVKRVEFLPYDAILPVLSYYFYYYDSNAVNIKHRDLLEQWFWRVAFSERYSGASQTRMTEDAGWIRSLSDGVKEYKQPISTSIDTLVEGSMRFTTSAVRNGFLCLLNLQNPLHLRNGTRIHLEGNHFSKFNLADNHHIFPINFLKKQGFRTREVHSLPNFCFLPAEINKYISDKSPSEYMTEFRNELGDQLFERVMKSHLIPVDEHSGIWTNNFERFLKQRAELIMSEIWKRCGISETIAQENRDPLVNSIEDALRDIIHIELSNSYGPDYWNRYVGKHINDEKLNERIEKYVRDTAGISKQEFEDPRNALNFCMIYDYLKIIKANWNIFSRTFISKSDLERAINDFNDFRNAVKHNRSIDSLQEHRAKASIIWFSRTLDLDLSKYDILTL